MLNPEHVSMIINRTLKTLKSDEPAMNKLIRSTFAVESYLTDLYDQNKYGFMMMSEGRIEYTTKEHIRYKSNLKLWVHTASGIDVSAESYNTIRDELQHNIAFMVCVLYAYFDSTGIDIKDDSIEEVWKVYRDQYNKESNIGLDDFSQTYVDVYLN